MSEIYIAPANGELLQFSVDIRNVISTLGHVYINIYTDEAGTTPANDTRGDPIINRLVSYTMYTYSHSDISSSQAENRRIRIHFIDGSKFEIIDPSTQQGPTGYWYSFEGLTPVTIKPLT
jgi:hypothetical protein